MSQYQPLSTEENQGHRPVGEQPPPASSQPNAAYGVPLAIPVANSVPQNMVLQMPVQYVPITPPAMTAAELEQRVYHHQVEFHSGRYISEAWNFMKHNFCQLLVVLVLQSIILLILQLFNAYVSQRLFPTFCANHNCPQNWKQMLFSFALSSFFSITVYYPMTASLFSMVFNALRSNSVIKISNGFSAFSCPYYPRILRLSAIYLFLGSILYLLFIVPGIWFSIASAFVIPLHVEHTHVNTKLALKYSIRVILNNFCSFLGFTIILIFLQIIGFFFFIVGLLVTIPLAFVSLCYCYHHLVGVNSVPYLAAQPVSDASHTPIVPVFPNPPLPPTGYPPLYEMSTIPVNNIPIQRI